MKARLMFLLILSVSLILRSAIVLAKDPEVKQESVITVSELLNHYQYWNQRPIIFFGEVIGQPIFSQNQVCLHILDQQGNVIGVWLDKKYLALIKCYGKYRIKGDQVEVKGTFHSVCSSHPGDTDIHADGLSILHVGEIASQEKPNWMRLVLGIFWLFLLLLFSFRIRNQRKKLKQ